MSKEMAMVGALVVVCCSFVSSATAMLMMGGDDTKSPSPSSPGPSGPACERNKSFDAQTGSFTCNSINAFKPEGATWWGSAINSGIPVSSEEATAAGFSHTFHTLSSSPTEKKYIAMRKTDQHCKMVEFDITKSGNTCSYSIKDAGYAGKGAGGMGATEACTASTDAEVIAKWNAKTPMATARTAATDSGYGLKSLKYSLYC